MSVSLDRALLLISQGRHALAEPELGRYLGEHPDHAFAHALLSLCLLQREAWAEATAAAREAVGLEPDSGFVHYVHAQVLRARDRSTEALEAIREAIRIDSADADFFWVLGAIHSDERRWKEALTAAEQGLQVDAEHVDCNNLRAHALVQLGRREEAGATLEAALSRDPENAVTHANVGWTRLHEARPKEALESFREALRLDPTHEPARAGVVEALKARNPLYGLLLRYFLWMARLPPRTQWALVLGGYIGFRMLAGAEEANPKLEPFTFPLRVAYFAFVVLSWTAQPLFNLLLRLNRYGRLALSEEQVRASNGVGLVVGLALAALVACVVGGFEGPAFTGLLASAGLIIPTAAFFNCRAGWPRRAMGWFTALLAAAGVLLFIGSFPDPGSTGPGRILRVLGALGGGAFLIGAIAAPWVANFLLSRRPGR